MASSPTKSSLHYDTIAADYDEMIEADFPIRECFWRRLETELRPHSRILDFGAGTGLDAGHFGDLRHEVTAYEPSDGMMRLLTRRCAGQIASGLVTPVAGRLDEARSALITRAPFDAVICNFAVLSTVADLDGLFRLFGQLTRSGSRILISIQNPWYPAAMRRPSFWRALLTMPVTGIMSNPSLEQGRTYRFTSAQVRRAARPEFVADQSLATRACRVHFGWQSRFALVALIRV
jgi:SAM-dependent methyltransferase